jgi:DNA uptake protein ComE-like DNA-binding protein
MILSRTPAAVISALMLALAACAGDAGNQDDSAAMTPDTSAAAATTPAANTSSDFLDPDAAASEELLAVPGLDSAAAEALVAGRPYETMLAVDSVLAPRMGEAERDSVYTRLWKPIDLNTASEQEILLIPGVGPRMQHEFEEYRPYTSMEQFRREIGKYVDEAEVARLERYVEIR